MSYYTASWYKGIVKPEYSHILEQVWAARDWAATDDERFNELMNEALYDETVFWHKSGSYDDPDLPENGYDPATRTLCYGMAVNKRGEQGFRIYNMYFFILPLITERVIFLHGWEEEMDHINTDMARYFEKDMDLVEKTLREGGFEKLMRELY